MFTLIGLLIAFGIGWIMVPSPNWADKVRNSFVKKINEWLDKALGRSE